MTRLKIYCSNALTFKAIVTPYMKKNEFYYSEDYGIERKSALIPADNESKTK